MLEGRMQEDMMQEDRMHVHRVQEYRSATNYLKVFRFCPLH